MQKILLFILLSFTATILNAQSKKEQIETITSTLDSLIKDAASKQQYFNDKIDSLKKTETNQRQNFIYKLDSLNKIISKNQKEHELQIDNARNKINELKTQIISLNSINESMTLELKTKDQQIDSLSNKIANLSDVLDSLSNPIIINENDWQLIESALKWIEKDHSKIIQWFNKNLYPASNSIYTHSCYSYILDAVDFNSGYPGSIEEEEFISKWSSMFDLNYASFSHPFENGNCGWASFKFKNIEFLGNFNYGDWYKLTILGGCGENDYSQTLVRVVKIIEENGSFKIANFISLRDN